MMCSYAYGCDKCNFDVYMCLKQAGATRFCIPCHPAADSGSLAKAVYPPGQSQAVYSRDLQSRVSRLIDKRTDHFMCVPSCIKPLSRPPCSFPTLGMQAQARDSSFCIFPRTHPVRRLTISIVENTWFNRLVLCIILANCVFLAIANPVCDTNIEIQENPECQNNPKWARVGSTHLSSAATACICTATTLLTVTSAALYCVVQSWHTLQQLCSH